jgi:hypothetical protein
MGAVFYLCRSPDEPESLVFANELPEHFYSPGFFVIEAVSRSGMLGGRFSFLARKGQAKINLELQQSNNSRVYIVDTASNGVFYFKAIALARTLRYSGQRGSLFNDMPLYRLEPANMMRLERECIDHDFYFTGSTGMDTDNF